MDQIRAAIESGDLEAGDRLPPERELAERLGVSRATVRDALRILEANRLVAIKVGAGGGATVTAPEPDQVREGLADMLMMSQIAPEDLTEARVIFELGSIDLICERATDGDVADLLEICTQSEETLARGSFDPALSAAFHTRLARSAHNVVIALITDALQEPVLKSLERARAIDPHMGDAGVTEHRRIVDAVQAKNASLARDILSAHLTRTAARLRSGKPSPTTDGDRMTGGVSQPSPDLAKRG